MKSLNLTHRTHGRLSLVLLGVLALNVSWLYPTPKEWGMTQLSSTQASSKVCPINQEGSTKPCNLTYTKKLTIKKKPADVTGAVHIVRFEEMVEKAQAQTQTQNNDPFAARPTAAEKKSVEKVSMTFYKVTVITNVSAADVDKDREETKIFSAKDFQGKSYSDLEIEFGQFARKSHANNIAKIMEEVKEEEKAEKEEARLEKLEADREDRVAKCLIKEGTPLDEKEVLLEGREKYNCNFARMKNTKDQKEATAIYNAEIKPYIIDMMTSSDSKDRSQGQGLLEKAANTNLGRSNGQVRASLGVIQKGSAMMNSLRGLQEQLGVATNTMHQAMIKGRITQLERSIQDELFQGASNLAQAGLADSTLGDTYAIFQKKFSGNGSALLGVSSQVQASRDAFFDSGLALQYDFATRTLRGNPVITGQGEFDSLLSGSNLSLPQQTGLPTFDNRTQQPGALGQTPPPPINTGSRVPLVGSRVTN